MKPVKRQKKLLFRGRKRRGPAMNETRFTQRAQTALKLAQQCSAELGHGYVGSEHLLLGLAQEGSGVAAKVLIAAGLDPDTLKAAIAALVGTGDRGTAPSQGLTPRCKKIIELSLTEAARLGHHYVGTEHLLLGILREGDGVAVRVLSGTGAGDTSIAAFLKARMDGCPIEDCLRYAAATGASCVEAYDALSGLRPFEELLRKIEAGWEKQ